MLKKSKKNIFFKFIYLSILILNAQMFMLPIFFTSLTKINSYHNKILITLFSLTLFIFWLLFREKGLKLGKADLLVISLLIIMGSLLFIQMITSKEENKLLLGNFYYNLILLLYFPLKSFFRDKINYIWFIKVYVNIGLLFTLCTIIFYYFFQDYVIQNNLTLVQLVNNKIRFPQTSDIIGSTVLFILIGTCLNIYSERISLILIIVCMYALLEVSNVRMISLLSLVLIVYYFYITLLKKERIYVKILSHMIVAFFTIIVLIRLDFLEKFIGVGQQQASVLYRFEVINHYRKHFFDNIIYGFGFSDYVKNIYNFTDIGILGFMFRYGILIVIWLVFLMNYFIKNIRFNFENKLIFIYFIGMSISLSLFDPQRILYFPIIFSIFSNYVERRETNEI
ncbi:MULTISPECIES: hypothetical protein [Enterococcus]|uniref:hypothetical protein n=1 Tax=Enterococcus TaxID=1350 RepID=UPI00189AC227|nr:hypothetical protein [Enterococcus mundtii]